MSQRCVEMVIGRLATDEAFRSEFTGNRDAALLALAAHGVELTEFEREALLAIDVRLLALFAESIPPCLQKIDLGRGPK